MTRGRTEGRVRGEAEYGGGGQGRGWRQGELACVGVAAPDEGSRLRPELGLPAGVSRPSECMMSWLIRHVLPAAGGPVSRMHAFEEATLWRTRCSYAPYRQV